MKTRIIFIYNWWNSDGSKEEPSPELQEILDNEATEFIKDSWDFGYTCGEMYYSNDEETENWNGFWELKSERVEK
jgi:hypothetical protein